MNICDKNEPLSAMDANVSDNTRDQIRSSDSSVPKPISSQYKASNIMPPCDPKRCQNKINRDNSLNMKGKTAQNIEYPSIAKEYGITGRVFVKFIVEKNGSISNVRVVRAVDKQLDKGAIRVVSMLPNFNPGMQNGRLVRVNYLIPVNFILQ